MRAQQVYIWKASQRIQVIQELSRREVVTWDEDNGFRVYNRHQFRKMIQNGLIRELTGNEPITKEKEMAAKQKIATNEFGVPLYIDKSNKSQLSQRVQLLKKVEKTGKSADGKKSLSKKAIERVKMHIRWYSAELRNLGKRKSKKKAA